MSKILIDTSVWSLVLRRKNPDQAIYKIFSEIVIAKRVAIIGAVWQETLSGIRHEEQFQKLRRRLSPFPDTIVSSGEFERAAQISNACRRNGIQGSNTDFLICAVAESHGWEIFTTDADFQLYQAYCAFTFHQ